MSDADQIWSNIRSVSEPVYQRNFYASPGSQTFSSGGADLMVEIRQLSNRDEHDKVVRNYYFLCVYGSLFLSVSPTLVNQGYDLIFAPANPEAQLLDTAPAGSSGSHSDSVSVSTSLSGSVGFFGESGTGTIGGSQTMSSSHSVTLPNVIITNTSHQSSEHPNAAIWQWRIVPGDPTEHGNLSVVANMIFQNTAESDSAFNKEKFKVNCTIAMYVADTDGIHGTHWFDDHHREVTGVLPPGAIYNYVGDRSGVILLPLYEIDIDIPPLPQDDPTTVGG